MPKKPSAANRGGKREGAGRPKGTGPYGEPTVPIRVPVSLVERVMELLRKYLHEAS